MASMLHELMLNNEANLILLLESIVKELQSLKVSIFKRSKHSWWGLACVTRNTIHCLSEILGGDNDIEVRTRKPCFSQYMQPVYKGLRLSKLGGIY